MFLGNKRKKLIEGEVIILGKLDTFNLEKMLVRAFWFDSILDIKLFLPSNVEQNVTLKWNYIFMWQTVASSHLTVKLINH